MTLLAERYELGQELGAGGMGAVVVAHDRVLGRDVAVKLLSPGADRVTRERFMREARSAARLHHPNAVAVYDTGEDDGRPYLVMELVRGRTLADLLHEEGRLEVEDAVGITVGVLDGLAAAHRSGMIHRDVKPGNVLLPDEGGVKLSDFGIAKALDGTDAELTVTGSLMGTPTYLAPELIGGERPSAASDVYSVGCLLYAQLAGEPPFTQGEALAIAYAHRNEPVPPIEDARPELPPELVVVVDRALAKDPAERFDSATAMRTALLDGPDAVAPAGGATVALAGAGAAMGAGADRTRALDVAGDEPTRVAGATAGAAAASAAAPGAAADGGRRWWMPLLIALAVLGIVLLLWALLTGGDVDEPEVPADDVEVTEEADEEPVEPTPDEPSDDDLGSPEDDPADEILPDEVEDPTPDDLVEEEEEQEGTDQPPPEEDATSEDETTNEEETTAGEDGTTGEEETAAGEDGTETTNGTDTGS